MFPSSIFISYALNFCFNKFDSFSKTTRCFSIDMVVVVCYSQLKSGFPSCARFPSITLLLRLLVRLFEESLTLDNTNPNIYGLVHVNLVLHVP